MSIAIIDLNPKSKGTITVAHSDPEAYPSVTFIHSNTAIRTIKALSIILPICKIKEIMSKI